MTLGDLVNRFCDNVIESKPCEMRFDGVSVRLYPILTENNPNWRKTHVGVVPRVTQSSQVTQSLKEEAAK